ncbi:MAG TPA: tetraacyldisaccharide 4'-kinase [Pyrinomonadaceae bacterium]|nr:tetraacyldisaccharide 4'-kinase [Acidobacteriota bacterium]HQZ95456.1 tetraacyldisaccharide 4'-kinase [Pyrinomonadaceae bacterium]
MIITDMLSLIGHIYGRVADLRNRLYDRGILESFDLGARTISIGNITTGGTGKTPLVAYVANLLADGGEKVCILTRGYGRKDPSKRVLVSDGNEILATPEESGDEPFELAKKLPGKAIIIADADRVAAAEWAIRKFGVTTFVLDDGFQHRRAKRDVDIVCIDATEPFGRRQMLPAGRLREPIENLRRSDVVVISRADLASIDNLRFEIADLNPDIPIFTTMNRISRVLSLRSDLDGSVDVESRRALAFCGLGNPENFYALLRRDGFAVTETRSFRDHHIYSQADVKVLEGLAKDCRAEIFLTTAKDAVKLSAVEFELPCYVVEIDIEINDPAAFAQIL